MKGNKLAYIMIALGIVLLIKAGQIHLNGSTVLSSTAEIAEPQPTVITYSPWQNGEVLAKKSASKTSQNSAVSSQLVLDQLADVNRPMSERLEQLKDLSKLSDRESLQILMQIAQEKTYLAPNAIKVLGYRKEVEVGAFLISKLNSTDSKSVVAAIEAYAQYANEKSAPALLNVLTENQVREDGYELQVRTAAVKELASIATPNVIPGLARELTSVTQPNWSLEYGSEIVKALLKTGDTSSYSILENYAAALKNKMPKDPGVQSYFTAKINEALSFKGPQ